jgi:hypothetical protein
MNHMTTAFIEGLPGRTEGYSHWRLCLRGNSAFVQSPGCLAGFSLRRAQLKWLVTRDSVRLTEAASRHPRRIHAFGLELWYGAIASVVAEILLTEDGTVRVVGRHVKTGEVLWDKHVPIPDAADWAEPSPAWPGAPTEEIYAFFADDPHRLVYCLFRESRRCRCSSPHQGIEVWTLPPYACQLDAVRLDPLTGRTMWRNSYRDLRVGIIERKSFVGIWSHSPRLGILDLDTGTNTVLYESQKELGWPVRDGRALAVPWYSKKEVGIDWVDTAGRCIRQAVWAVKGVRDVWLHNTGAGLALQTNDQTLWWLGDGTTPLWSVRAKPYIYKVLRSTGTDVFIGTDGNGGRLFAYDATTGRETLNLRPPYGGAGHLTKVPGHDVLVFNWSRKPTGGQLCVVSMRDRQHYVEGECSMLLGTWQHGAVCAAGRNCERLAIIDFRGDS